MVLLATEHPRDRFLSCGAQWIIYFANKEEVSCSLQYVIIMCSIGKYCTIKFLQGPIILGRE